MQGGPAPSPVIPNSQDQSPRSQGSTRRITSFLRRHPILCLLLLTPSIPEYLSGSSPMYALVLNPPGFVIQVLLNLGLYGPGVLLIREAMIRWNKGWGSVLLLGAAYAILEEGVAVDTLFNPKAGPVGNLGLFGHWLGVSWIWVAEILPVHMIFSISIPILLLGLALPLTRGKSLLSRRGVSTVSVTLCADVVLLFSLVSLGGHYWMGTPVLLGSIAAMGVLVLAARRVPGAVVHARTALPRRSPRVMGLVGLAFFPVVVLTEGIGSSPLLVFFLVIGVQILFLFFVLREMGAMGNELQLLAFTFGLVIPVLTVGLVTQIRLPVVLIADLAWVLLYRTLWRRYKAEQSFASGSAAVTAPVPAAV